MPTFFFNLAATPTTAANNADDIAGGVVFVFVTADGITQADAETLARSTVINYGWIPGTVLFSAQPTLADLARLETDIIDIYRRSVSHTVGFLFVARPKVEGQPDDPAQYRSLGAPWVGSA